MTARARPATVLRRGERLSLVALLNGRHIGDVYQAAAGILGFAYVADWRSDADAYPLSLSMPLTAERHRHDAISAFLWGLLPDNHRTLEHYGRLFGVSPRNPVALLSHIGADCAGAVQFSTPERVPLLMGSSREAPSVEWLTEADVARELRAVRKSGIAGTTRQTAGQFSLAGAQPKIALFEESGRWGRPIGRTPTNRILKPPTRDFASFAENEHFCLELASRLGLASARSRVVRFEDEITIVVERFDRVKSGKAYHRVHQEDVCQALAVLPTGKHENEGGPGVRGTINLLRDASRKPQDDVERFLRATILTWVLAATDAHAKNYALLHSAGGGVRLAPLYDIASFLPYAEPSLYRVKLAMKIGGKYLIRQIHRRSWETLAKDNGLDTRDLTDMVMDLLARLPDAVSEVADDTIQEGLDAAVIHPLTALIRKRVEDCTALMTHKG